MGTDGEHCFIAGDIVWVKLSNRWWPAEVQDERNVPEDFQAIKKPVTFVKFFNENSYEFVKSSCNIYSYNCDRKDEFIKKGMDAFRANNPNMVKFPEDVTTAELRTNGNPNILSDPKFSAQKKSTSSIIAEIFKSPSKKTLKESMIKHKSNKSTVHALKNPQYHITHRRFLGCNDYESRILIQYPGKDCVDYAPIEDPELEKTYPCSLCGYTTTRVEVMLYHIRCHNDGTHIFNTNKKKTVKRPPKKEYCIAPQTNPSNIRNDLLAEWDDKIDSDEEGVFISASAIQEVSNTDKEGGSVYVSQTARCPTTDELFDSLLADEKLRSANSSSVQTTLTKTCDTLSPFHSAVESSKITVDNMEISQDVPYTHSEEPAKTTSYNSLLKDFQDIEKDTSKQYSDVILDNDQRDSNIAVQDVIADLGESTTLLANEKPTMSCLKDCHENTDFLSNDSDSYTSMIKSNNFDYDFTTNMDATLTSQTEESSDSSIIDTQHINLNVFRSQCVVQDQFRSSRQDELNAHQTIDNALKEPSTSIAHTEIFNPKKRFVKTFEKLSQEQKNSSLDVNIEVLDAPTLKVAKDHTAELTRDTMELLEETKSVVDHVQTEINKLKCHLPQAAVKRSSTELREDLKTIELSKFNQHLDTKFCRVTEEEVVATSSVSAPIENSRLGLEHYDSLEISEVGQTNINESTTEVPNHQLDKFTASPRSTSSQIDICVESKPACSSVAANYDKPSISNNSNLINTEESNELCDRTELPSINTGQKMDVDVHENIKIKDNFCTSPTSELDENFEQKHRSPEYSSRPNEHEKQHSQIIDNSHSLTDKSPTKPSHLHPNDIGFVNSVDNATSRNAQAFVEKISIDKLVKKGNGKAKILQQTIIKPAVNVMHATQQMENEFDINSMPIVISEKFISSDNINEADILLHESDTVRLLNSDYKSIKKCPPESKALDKNENPGFTGSLKSVKDNKYIIIQKPRLHNDGSHIGNSDKSVKTQNLLDIKYKNAASKTSQDSCSKVLASTKASVSKSSSNRLLITLPHKNRLMSDGKGNASYSAGPSKDGVHSTVSTYTHGYQNITAKTPATSKNLTAATHNRETPKLSIKRQISQKLISNSNTAGSISIESNPVAFPVSTKKRSSNVRSEYLGKETCTTVHHSPPSTKSNQVAPVRSSEQIKTTAKLCESSPKSTNQILIQDGSGNQTTITEGQILALPNETVDGQTQSYMLVTLDHTGNLTPINNEALMSLDPNLNLEIGSTTINIGVNDQQSSYLNIEIDNTSSNKEDLVPNSEQAYAKLSKQNIKEQNITTKPLVPQEVMIGKVTESLKQCRSNIESDNSKDILATALVESEVIENNNKNIDHVQKVHSEQVMQDIIAHDSRGDQLKAINAYERESTSTESRIDGQNLPIELDICKDTRTKENIIKPPSTDDTKFSTVEREENFTKCPQERSNLTLSFEHLIDDGDKDFPFDDNGEMCSSLSEPPPDMFEFTDHVFSKENNFLRFGNNNDCSANFDKHVMESALSAKKSTRDDRYHAESKDLSSLQKKRASNTMNESSKSETLSIVDTLTRKKSRYE